MYDIIINLKYYENKLKLNLKNKLYKDDEKIRKVTE
jgi:hypothetical protein